MLAVCIYVDPEERRVLVVFVVGIHTSSKINTKTSVVRLSRGIHGFSLPPAADIRFIRGI
jgi:hypothetical protein